jgi:hypothetical protein
MIRLFKQVFFILIIVILSGGTVFSGESRYEKSHTRAFLLSLLVPGFGQYYAQSPGYAKLFLSIELAIWGGYYYNTTMMNISRDDYLGYAALHAGVNPSGSGSSYLNAVGSYPSSYVYNSRQLQKSFHPILYTGEKSWNWESERHRATFKVLRERELDYENNKKFCVAGIIVNHFLSAIHASKQVQGKNKSSAVMITGIDGGIMSLYIRSF